MLVTMAGLFTFFFGLLADQNARIRTELEHYRSEQRERQNAIYALVDER